MLIFIVNQRIECIQIASIAEYTVDNWFTYLLLTIAGAMVCCVRKMCPTRGKYNKTQVNSSVKDINSPFSNHCAAVTATTLQNEKNI